MSQQTISEAAARSSSASSRGGPAQVLGLVDAYLGLGARTATIRSPLEGLATRYGAAGARAEQLIVYVAQDLLFGDSEPDMAAALGVNQKSCLRLEVDERISHARTMLASWQGHGGSGSSGQGAGPVPNAGTDGAGGGVGVDHPYRDRMNRMLADADAFVREFDERVPGRGLLDGLAAGFDRQVFQPAGGRSTRRGLIQATTLQVAVPVPFSQVAALIDDPTCWSDHVSHIEECKVSGRVCHPGGSLCLLEKRTNLGAPFLDDDRFRLHERLLLRTRAVSDSRRSFRLLEHRLDQSLDGKLSIDEGYITVFGDDDESAPQTVVQIHKRVGLRDPALVEVAGALQFALQLLLTFWILEICHGGAS